MREVVAGVWHWKGAHPDWKPGQTWDQLVSSYAVDTGEGLVLFDPVDVPAELRERAVAVVLTCPWHRRDASQLGLPIHVPPPDAPDPDPVRGQVSAAATRAVRHPRIRRLRAERPRPLRREPSCGRRRRHADRSGRWAPGASGVARRGCTREDVIQRLRPLLDLPVDVVLPMHAEPADRAALERALSV